MPTSGRRSGLAGFGQWWVHELSGIAPARLRTALERRRLRPVVYVDGDRVSFWRPMLQDNSYRMQEVASIALGSDLNAAAGEGRAAMAALIPEGAYPAVTLALPAKQILRRTLTLPAAVADNLRATVGYDLDRLTPFKPEDVYFDTTILARDNARGTLTAEVVAARRRAVDQAVALVTSFGADVVAVVPAAPGAGGPVAPRPPAHPGAPRGQHVDTVAGAGAARAARCPCGHRGDRANLAKARRHHSLDQRDGSGERARPGIRQPAHRARAHDRQLQLHARTQAHASQRRPDHR